MIYVGIIGSILLLLLVMLESIFYFSPTVKLIVIYSSIFSLVAFTLYWFVSSQLIKMEKMESYKINKFAVILGEKLFPNKKDTIINALQLEDGDVVGVGVGEQLGLVA